MHFAQAGHPAFELPPDPDRKPFDGRRLKPRNVVKITVVEPALHGHKRRLEVCEMKHKAGLHVGLALCHHAHAKGMAVNLRVGMAGGRRGQVVGGFKAEFLVKLDHGRRTPVTAVR